MGHGLKKGVIGMMWMVYAAVISACSPSPAAEPAVLPPEGQVRTVSVERDGAAADCGNQKQIGVLLDALPESGEPVLNDRIPMVMADGAMYYDTGRESTVTGRCGVMDGEITSAVDQTEVPSENDQSNFGAGYGYQWGPEEGTLEVCMDGKWLVFERQYVDDNRVYFAGRWHDKSGLSEDTLRWLAWYNGLSEEEQACISAVPSDLLDESGISRTEETDAQAD